MYIHLKLTPSKPAIPIRAFAPFNDGFSGAPEGVKAFHYGLTSRQNKLHFHAFGVEEVNSKPKVVIKLCCGVFYFDHDLLFHLL